MQNAKTTATGNRVSKKQTGNEAEPKKQTSRRIPSNPANKHALKLCVSAGDHHLERHHNTVYQHVLNMAPPNFNPVSLQLIGKGIVRTKV